MATVGMGVKALAVGLTFLRLFLIDNETAGAVIENMVLLLELIDLGIEIVRANGFNWRNRGCR